MSDSSSRHWPLYLLFFGSGATSLVYEVLWLRQLILVFGSTLFATSAVLSTFMGGLALGAFVAGRLVDRERVSPLRLYALLEIGIGVYAVAVPLLLASLTPLYRLAWEAGGSENFRLLSLAKFAGIVVVLLLPTTMMGATLPAMSRLVADDPDRIGGKVGAIYATNTFGAAVGTLLAGFLLIPVLGMRLTGWGTAAANVALGLVALGMARQWRAGTPIAPGNELPRSEKALRFPGLLPGTLALSGFAAMVLEVAWTRGLALVVGSSVYAFSLMLLTFLLGLAGGGAFFSRLLRGSLRRHAAPLLAGLLVAGGLLAFATSFVLQRLPELLGRAYYAWDLDGARWLALQLFFAAVVMLPATFVLGGVFPAGLQLYARDLNRVAGSVGRLYAANTAGTIAGAASAGFLLIPDLGLRNTVIGISMLQLVLALVVVLALAAPGTPIRRTLLVAGLAGLVILPAAAPDWNLRLMNSGAYYVLHDRDAHGWQSYLEDLEEDEIVYAREGLTASVVVVDQPLANNRFLAVNGKPEASSRMDLETQLMIAHAPLLMHPQPNDVLVIGLASGITAGAATTHPIESLRVVEIEDAVIPAAELFAEHNHDVLDDPRVTVSINDARNELAFSPATYDVIISEPSNPWLTVAANLFTEDFFRLARPRVREGGIFCQWIQNYGLPWEDLRAVIAAFRSSFPHVTVLQTLGGIDLMLLGSEEPIRWNMDQLAGRMNELQVRLDLARVGIRSPEDLLPLFVVGDRELDRLLVGARRNTDDNALVEFSAPLAFYADTIDDNVARLLEPWPDFLAYVDPPPDATQTAHLRLGLARAWKRRGEDGMARHWAREALDGPGSEEASRLLEELDL